MIAIGADTPSPRAVSSSLPPPASSLSLTGGSVVYVQMDQQTIADYPVGGAATTPTFRYVYASYIDEPVVRKGPTSTSTAHFYHRNHQYSVTAITTSTGAIAERYAYTAYGQPTILNASGSVISATTLTNRYTYTGREWDATLGLHHFRARWMSPSAGRFLGRDPIGYEGSEWGLYEYCSSAPLHGLDPTGLTDWSKWPSEYPRNITIEEIERLLKTCKGDDCAKLRLMKKILQQQPRLKGKGKGGRGSSRRGICNNKVAGGIFLLGCEAACAEAYDDCLDNSLDTQQNCMDGCAGLRTLPGNVYQSCIDNCTSIAFYDQAECGINYTACGLGCMIPFSFF